ETEMCPFGAPKFYGTIDFTAPERLSKSNRTRKLGLAKQEDMYALGSLLYELITLNTIPWAREIKPKISKKMIEKERGMQQNAITELNKSASLAASSATKTFLSLVARLLGHDPQHRPNINTFLSEIAKVKSQLRACHEYVFIADQRI